MNLPYRSIWARGFVIFMLALASLSCTMSLVDFAPATPLPGTDTGGATATPVALAETMVALKEKSSINELEKIINNKQTPDPVKNKLKGCIQQII